VRILAWLFVGILVAGMTAWSAGALYYSPLPSETLRAVLAGAFVELRAPNYPGSAYTLTYDPHQDQLRGIYFQAVER